MMVDWSKLLATDIGSFRGNPTDFRFCPPQPIKWLGRYARRILRSAAG